MTKDNFLFAVIGLLFGFITGYLLHEVMATRQPARRPAGEPAVSAADSAPAMADPAGVPAADATGGPAAGGAGAPAMAQVRELQERVKKNPDDTEALLKLANLNFDIRNFGRAKDLYVEYLKKKPGDPDVMTDLGICIKETGEPDKALELFRQVEKIAPQHWPSVFNEVVVLAFDLKRFDDADRALAHLRQLQPNNSKVEELAAEVARRRSAG